MTSKWTRWRLKSPVSLLFTQPFIQGADQKKHQSSASLAFVRGIHRWPVNSPHKGPVTRKMFPFGDVIMHLRNVLFIIQTPEIEAHERFPMVSVVAVVPSKWRHPMLRSEPKMSPQPPPTFVCVPYLLAEVVLELVRFKGWGVRVGNRQPAIYGIIWKGQIDNEYNIHLPCKYSSSQNIYTWFTL